jgi:hypothetical protein
LASEAEWEVVSAEVWVVASAEASEEAWVVASEEASAEAWVVASEEVWGQAQAAMLVGASEEVSAAASEEA